jgi:RimJ/RimL family protein N-acetyltransferase
VREIDEFWAEFLGVEVAALGGARCIVVPHARLAGYSGAWLFVRGSAAIVSVPADLVSEITPRAARVAPLELHASVDTLFGSRVARVIGPTYLGWLEPARFRAPATSAAVRPLRADENELVAQLASACDANEWEASAIEVGEPGLVGAFEDGLLVAVAKLREWAPGVGDLGVISHPARRGQGHARAAVAKIVERALETDWLVIYQTLEANTAAVAIAAGLGFARYATNCAIRLHLG